MDKNIKISLGVYPEQVPKGSRWHPPSPVISSGARNPSPSQAGWFRNWTTRPLRKVSRCRAPRKTPLPSLRRAMVITVWNGSDAALFHPRAV